MNRSMKPTTDRLTSRRALLRAGGAIGVATTTGCLGDDDSSDRTRSSESDGSGSESDSDDAGTGSDSDDSDSSGDEPLRLDAEDGWRDPHPGVEVPDEPGSAILKIGEETVRMTGGLIAQELAEEETGRTGAERFEIQGHFSGGEYQGDRLRVDLTRRVGYQDTVGRWAEGDSFGLTRGDGARLGNVVYRSYEDGRVADEELAGDLDGRRFVADPFVHANRDGVVTVVETVDSHLDSSLNGRFELGARRRID